MVQTGRVLWWSAKDENGIIVDTNGNEFYFDRSVLKLNRNQIIQDDSIVLFSHNQNVTDCLCANNVRVPTKSKKRHYEKDFDTKSFVEM